MGQLTANSNACIHYRVINRAPSISDGGCRLGCLGSVLRRRARFRSVRQLRRLVVHAVRVFQAKGVRAEKPIKVGSCHKPTAFKPGRRGHAGLTCAARR